MEASDLHPFVTISKKSSRELPPKAATDALRSRKFPGSPAYNFNIIYAIEGSVLRTTAGLCGVADATQIFL